MLNELVANELEEATMYYEAQENFSVINLEQANWCFRKLRALKEQETEFTELARKETERIKNWYNEEVLKLEQQAEFFKGLLTEYALQQKRENAKFKISTPYGKVSFRKQQPKWNYDEEAVINWAKQNDRADLIRVKEELDKKQLKWYAKQNGNYAVTEDGEIIPGIEILEQDEAIKIEVNE